jgi:hypothetical protein
MRRAEPSLEDHLAGLTQLDLSLLRERWTDHFGHPAPKRLSRDRLARAIGYQIQAKQYGGLRPALRRHLERLRDGVDSAAARSPASQMQPGARLMREWNGETHIVEVHTDGFAWNGEHYRSLSAVAYAITGARWSGPRFFGLHERAHARDNGGSS